MFWYIFWIIVVLFILCGLFAQYEIEAKNEDRKARRDEMREAAWDELERVDYLS